MSGFLRCPKCGSTDVQVAAKCVEYHPINTPDPVDETQEGYRLRCRECLYTDSLIHD